MPTKSYLLSCVRSLGISRDQGKGDGPDRRRDAEPGRMSWRISRQREIEKQLDARENYMCVGALEMTGLTPRLELEYWGQAENVLLKFD